MAYADEALSSIGRVLRSSAPFLVPLAPLPMERSDAYRIQAAAH